MSNLRKLLDKRVDPVTIAVLDGGETYTLKGMPDNGLLSILLNEPNKLELTARAYTNALKDRGTDAPFTEKEVWQVMMVQRYLSPLEDGSRLSDIETAILAKEHGPLFMKLFVAAFRIANNRSSDAKVGEQEIDDAATLVGLGNSDGGAPKDGTSSSSAASPAAGSIPKT